ncbi:hypothetical protein [Oceanobacillus massiliensis]|uniref:hypothetical protein n=1 Tax=Oceanobacillus massiliensis TaxID=1465765 RepID=UPI0002899A38|nr:hypothetical protein [Oceanobacillus massiliensis]
MNKHWTKTHTFLVFGMVIVIFLIYGICYLSILKPLHAEQKSMEKEISMYEGNLESIIDGKENDISETVNGVGSEVLDMASPEEVLTELQAMASGAGVSIDYIGTDLEAAVQQPEGQDKDSLLNETSYRMDATSGDLQAIDQFLDGLSETVHSLRVDSINLQQEDSEIFLELTFTAFYAG